MLQFEIHSICGFNWCKTTFSKIQLFRWILAWKIGILVFPSAKGQKREMFKNLNCRLLFIPNGFKKSGCPKNMTTSPEIWLSPPTSSYLQTNVFSIATILGLWALSDLDSRVTETEKANLKLRYTRDVFQNLSKI